MTPRQFSLAGQRVRLQLPAHVDQPTSTPPVAPGQDALPLPDEVARDRTDPRDARLDMLTGAAARQLVEVLQGRRSATQAATWMDEDTHMVVMAWHRQRNWSGCRVVSVRPCPLSPDTVEASVHLADGDHMAAAIRLEHRDGRWVLTLFEVMLPPAVMDRVAA